MPPISDFRSDSPSNFTSVGWLYLGWFDDLNFGRSCRWSQLRDSAGIAMCVSFTVRGVMSALRVRRATALSRTVPHGSQRRAISGAQV